MLVAILYALATMPLECGRGRDEKQVPHPRLARVRNDIGNA